MALEREKAKCCASDLVIHIVASRWTVAILEQLGQGAKRPSELSRGLRSISAKTLTQRLRELEDVGILSRESYQEIPPRVVYTLTDRGQDLLFIIEALKEMGESWQRSLPEYQADKLKPNDQCAHCHEAIMPKMQAALSDARELENQPEKLERGVLNVSDFRHTPPAKHAIY